jgi:diguanylate cyclase (GGDEF)-like protein
MQTSDLEDLQEQVAYWEERALKAEQRLVGAQENHQKRLESLNNQLAQAESRANILQAEKERLQLLQGAEPAAHRPGGAESPTGDTEQKLHAAEERARLFENELREVHYKVADRLLKEPPEQWWQPFEFQFAAPVPEQRTEELLDRYYRISAYAESLRQQLQRVSAAEQQAQSQLSEMQRALQTAQAEAPKAADAEVERLAFEDEITGLPNQRLAERYLEQQLERARQGQITVGLLSIDLDRFRSINLTLGLDAGDAILRAVADRIKSRLTPGEVFARGRDDEFLVVVTLPGTDVDATQALVTGIAGRVLADLQQPVASGTHHLTVGCGCGAVVSRGEESLRLLLERAHLATARAKKEGRNRFKLYAPSMEDAGRRRLNLGSQLQQAIQLDQLALQYQPIWDLSDGTMWGTEALLRWNHPQHGILEPGHFIDIAQESGLIVPLGEWVVREATKVAAQLEKLYLSINLSAQELMQADFVRRFTKLLELSHVTRPERLILEVTEREFGPEADRIAHSLKELRRWNIGIAIDDFTFDALSLRRVQETGVGHIKLDQILTHNLHDPLCEGLARAAVQLAANLKCKVWAEGVETTEQLAQLKEMGVHFGQGNLLCPPLLPGALRDRLKSGK